MLEKCLRMMHAEVVSRMWEFDAAENYDARDGEYELLDRIETALEQRYGVYLTRTLDD